MPCFAEMGCNNGYSFIFGVSSLLKFYSLFAIVSYDRDKDVSQ